MLAGDLAKDNGGYQSIQGNQENEEIQTQNIIQSRATNQHQTVDIYSTVFSENI